MQTLLEQTPGEQQLSLGEDSLAFATFDSLPEDTDKLDPRRRMVVLVHAPSLSFAVLSPLGEVIAFVSRTSDGGDRLDTLLANSPRMAQVLALLGNLPTGQNGALTVRQALVRLEQDPDSLRGQDVMLLGYLGVADPILGRPFGPAPGATSTPCATEPFEATLTDLRHNASVSYLNGLITNPVPASIPYVWARLRLGSTPPMPSFALFTGHFFDPGYQSCTDGHKVFVITDLSTVYDLSSRTLPGVGSAGLSWETFSQAWPTLHDPNLSFSLHRPPGWTVIKRQEQGYAAVYTFRAPGRSVELRVTPGEAYFDPWVLPSQEHPIFQGWQGGGLLRIGNLDAMEVERHDLNDPKFSEKTLGVIISGLGNTYLLTTSYKPGVPSPQPLLSTYSGLVMSFRFDRPVGPTPTFVKTQLGPGPFISRDQAEALVLADAKANDPPPTIKSAALQTEYEARQVNHPCGTFRGHPDGVWVVVAYGVFREGAPPTDYMAYVDATNGKRLCSSIGAPPIPGWAPLTPPPPPKFTPTPDQGRPTAVLRL